MEFSILRVNPLVSMTILAAMLSSFISASAKGGQSPAPNAGAAAAAQQQEQAAMQRAQQAQVQAVQQQQHAQQEAMQQMQAKQQEARVQQEQAMRVQEEQARQMQMKAVQQQQEQARNMQQQQQKMQQEQARNVQEQQQKMQQEQARNMQEQQQKMQQEQAHNIQAQGENARRNNTGRQEVPARQEASGRPEMPGGPQGGMNRALRAKPLGLSTVPIEKAVPQPVLAANAHPGEQEHSQAVTQNLQRHLLAVPGAQAPQNRAPLMAGARTNYFNNYATVVNNRRININRENTNVSYFQPNQYPTWYQPQPNWVLSNGFTLGNDIHCGLDWLQWGWHPYYGPPPEGFVCSDDYFPTPWVYIPAYGVWRQPGEFAYSPSGPPYDYTGPISVEVLEPRHVHTRDPYSGWVNDSVINVVYFYDAFYYPDMDRWGYMNRHGYFIWLNIDPDDGGSY